MALLHATARMAAELGGIEVLALHVHHGLSPYADQWLSHVRDACERWAVQGWPVRLCSRELNLKPAKGESVEALARQARYAALAEMALQARCSAVLLAHHRQDQAETFMLQAMRGAGVAGLAAMPRCVEREGVAWLRPWLDHPRALIEAYVAEHQVPWVDDDSNSDARYARNRLRLAVWPALTGAFEQAEAALAQAAAHQSDVLACLGDWLAERLPQVCAEQGGTIVLLIAPWAAHSPGPQRELLRAWFRERTGCSMPQSWVMRVQREALNGLACVWPITGMGLHHGDRPLAGELALYRGVLSWRDHVQGRALGQGSDPAMLQITGPGEVPLPGGTLVVAAAAQGGIPLSLLNQCTWQPRVGGEQFQLAPGRPARSLKKQFQSLAVPAWQRHPFLLWSGDVLVFVPGLGLDARACALPGEPRVSLAWRADS